MPHHDLDIETGAAVTHDDLVAGAAVPTGPADLAELCFTLDGDIGVVGQMDRQGARLGTDAGAARRDRSLDGGRTGLDEGVGDLFDVEEFGASCGDADLAEVRHAFGVEAARGDLDVDGDIGVDPQELLLAEAL